MNHDSLLTRVIELSAESRARGDHPFGALLAIDGEVVQTARNRVNTDSDITAHAETTLVRKLEREDRLGLLAEGVVYASCEPCPMCVGALFWAGGLRVTFALSDRRLQELVTPADTPLFGFVLGARDLGESANPPMRFRGPEREEDAIAVHDGFWSQ